MSTGFTKTGQPIVGRKYTIVQGDFSLQCTLVGKAYGPGGNADCIGVFFEVPDGRRGLLPLPWPVVASEGAEPIVVTAGWKVADVTSV